MSKQLFDRPLRRDPLFWWALVLAFMAMASTSSQYPNGVYNNYTATAFLIDLAFNGVIQVGLLAGIPALIRHNRRRRKSLKVEPADEVS